MSSSSFPRLGKAGQSLAGIRPVAVVVTSPEPDERRYRRAPKFAVHAQRPFL
jgi:hypothetical protein